MELNLESCISFNVYMRKWLASFYAVAFTDLAIAFEFAAASHMITST